MLWGEKVGAEPYLALNMGTGTLEYGKYAQKLFCGNASADTRLIEIALAWLEYCNSDQDTYYANMRRTNGHEKPYNVKYWALGNEIWGPWSVADVTIYPC